MTDILNLSAIASISLLAAVSPGPDFFIVVKNSLSYSRKSGLMTALGVSLALIFHLAYTLVGLAVLVAESPRAYTFIKYVGVCYLFYLGISSIIASFKKVASLDLEPSKLINQQSNMKSLRQGFLTNLLNPKAAVFFISLFSQFIDSNTSVFVKIEYGFINWIITLAWFVFVSYLITLESVKNKINRLQVYIDRVLGGIFMMLGTKLLFI